MLKKENWSEVAPEISEVFHERFDETLNNLSDMQTGKNKSKSKVRKWVTAVASTAAALVLSTGFLMANPVLAAKIPIIGKIFERVEDKVTYSGDFKDKADVLVAVEEAEAVSAVYSVEDQGVTFTASEVYCDGHSLYLTAKVESKDGGFTDMTGYANDDGTERVKHMYAWGGGRTAQGITGENNGQSLEGDVIDDNTFVGMMKIDFDEVVSEEGVFDLELTMLGFDGVNNQIDIDVGHRYDGSWKLTIPYTVDTQNTKTIEVNEDIKDGFSINKVFISPYQLIMYSSAPYETPEGEYLSQDFEFGAYNQDGEELQWGGAILVGDQWVSRFTVKGLDVSKLQIFFGEEFLSMIKAENIDDAKEKAIWSTEIDVK